MDKDELFISSLRADSEAEKTRIALTSEAIENQPLYADFGGALHYLKPTRNGQLTPERLCNFSAEITREVIKTDGITTTRYFTVSGRLETGKPLPQVDVPASEFDRLEWLVSSWGSGPQIAVGTRYKDHVVAAIKERSGPELVQISQHTGWAEFGEDLVYLTASGAIGADGLNEDARCELQGPLTDYNLPTPVDPRTLDLVSILEKFRDVHNAGLGLVLLGAVMRSVLCHFRPATCSVYLQGTTGTYKSALAGVVQGFWGTSFDGAHLPANWSSTGNALEKTAFLAKDSLLVVDDFVARGTRQEVAKTHSNAERLLRAQGNQAGRSRMTSQAELRNAFYPRGMILATGEDVPNGHSLQARMVIISVAKGAIDISILSELQRLSRDGTLSKVMASFVEWLATEAKENMIDNMISEYLECDRENIGHRGHARTQDNLANLLIGLRAFLEFASEPGEVSYQITDTFMGAATSSAIALADLQASIDHEASEAQRFIDLLRAAVSSGKAHFESAKGGQPDNAHAFGWRQVDAGRAGLRTEAMGARIGWIDGEMLMIDPSPALNVVKALSSALDNHLGSSERAISKNLKEAGLIKKNDKGRITYKASVAGVRRSVLAFHLPDIFDLDETSNWPVDHDETDIPF